MHEICSVFAAAIQRTYRRTARGQAEEQLKRPVSELIEAVGHRRGQEVETTPEIVAAEGRPDIGVLCENLLCGHVELKAPRENVDPDRMGGRNLVQWRKFSSLPNLIYTNGREWRLYRTGELAASVIFEGEPSIDGADAVSPATSEALGRLITAFITWAPLVPTRPRELARFLAPLTRVLRDDVSEALRRGSESLTALQDEWRAYLFPEVTDSQFADAYAQTVVSALLLARLEGAEGTNPQEAEQALLAHNSLLGRILRILTQEEVREDIRLGLGIIERVMRALDVDALNEQESDLWLYFYEDFLHAYDPRLARDAGVYYTPAQVVRCQVGLVSELLEGRFAKTYSFAHEGVSVLDPAVGTGTYLVAAIQHAMQVVEREAGAQRPARAAVLARNLIGFELLVGPYAVAHLRLSRELASAAGEEGADPLAEQPLQVFLADTLESPEPPDAGVLVPLSHRPLVNEREQARQIKVAEPVIVCIGNPPYDRQMDEGAARKGGWVRFGDQRQEVPILEDFLEPARRAGEGANIRSIYNDYVYFWRWALWKVFETPANREPLPGIVSFITGSSYLRGPGFVGMREFMRKTFDELWIIDLGGDNLGARREPNVFAIQTPVAIAIGVRGEDPDEETPATTRYVRLAGSRDEKLAQLNAIRSFDDVPWRDCPDEWWAAFKPPLQGAYAAWPSIRQIMPWQHNGAQFVRTWPIASTEECLRRRWESLLDGTEEERKAAFHESRDRTIEWNAEEGSMPGSGAASIATLAAGDDPPAAIRYAYRSLDRQFALYDARLGDYLKPPIWAAHGPRQIYLSTLLNTAIGFGPAATLSALIPDLHHFRGSFGGKDLFPLYRDREATAPNMNAGLLATLAEVYERDVTAEDLFCYLAGVLCNRTFVGSFWDELETPGVNVPITKSFDTFQTVVAIGRRYITLETYGDRYPDEGRAGRPPQGAARVEQDVPHTADEYPDAFVYDEDAGVLTVGRGRIVGVSRAVWEYEVSGYFVVNRWLAYRMRDGAGRTSSSLDEIRPAAWTAAVTDELLQLLWVVEHLIALEPDARAALQELVAGRTFTAAELPQPTPAETRPPVVAANRRPRRPRRRPSNPAQQDLL